MWNSWNWTSVSVEPSRWGILGSHLNWVSVRQHLYGDYEYHEYSHEHQLPWRCISWTLNQNLGTSNRVSPFAKSKKITTSCKQNCFSVLSRVHPPKIHTTNEDFVQKFVCGFRGKQSHNKACKIVRNDKCLCKSISKNVIKVGLCVGQ